MSIGQFLKGLALALLPALVCVGALLGIAALLDARPQQGPMLCSLDRLWVPPDGSLIYRIIYSGPPSKSVAIAAPPIDVVFVVDESSSLEHVTAAMPKAVAKATQALARPDNANRYALLYFDVDKHLVQDWTNDATQITEAAALHKFSGGGTNANAALDGASELLNRLPSEHGRRDYVMIFSDGEFFPPYGYIETARRLRERGVSIYFVLAQGAQGSDRSMAEKLTGSADHVIELGSDSELPVRLEQTVTELLKNAASVKGTLRAPEQVFSLDEGHPLAGNWYRDGPNALSSTASQGASGGVLELPLRAKEWGLWPVGLEPAQATILDAGGHPVVSNCNRRPYVVVAPLWLLPLLLLPALLWALHAIRLWRRRSDEPSPTSLPPASIEPFVRTLSLPAKPGRLTEEFVPTVVVGIGDAGSRTCSALRSELEDLQVTPAPTLAALIVTAAQDAGAEGIETETMPSACADTASYLPAPGDPIAPDLAWLDRRRFADRQRGRLDVSAAGADDRMLNRFAFLHWLDQGLRGKLAALAAAAAHDPATGGQIFLVGDTGESFVSACALDVARIMRDATADKPVDIAFLQLAPSRIEGAANGAAFAVELQTSTRLATQSALAPGGAGADGTRAPIDRTFAVEGGDVVDAATQAILMLMRKDVARDVYSASRQAQQARRAAAGTVPLQLRAAKVGFKVRQLSGAVALEIFQRWAVHSVLGAVEGDANGGYRLAPARALPAKLAEMLSKDADIGENARALIRIAQASPDCSDFVTMLASSPKPDVVRRLVVNGLDELVQRVGRKDLRASDVLALAQALKDGLASSALMASMRAAGLANAEDLLSAFSSVIDQFGSELQNWTAAVLTKVGNARQAQDVLISKPYGLLEQGLGRKIDRALLEELADDLDRRMTAGRETRASAAWVMLRAQLDNNRPRIEGRIAIAGQFATTQSDEFLATLSMQANQAVESIQQYTLAWLLRRDPDCAKRLARELVLDPGPGGKAITGKPFATDPGERGDIARLVREIPKLSGSAELDRQIGSNDRQSLRRLAYSDATPAPPASFGQTPDVATKVETAAERGRMRLQSNLGISLPQFPAALRAAFCDGDAILRFARLNAAGRVRQRIDDAGRAQWFVDSTQLTFDDRASLAEALSLFAIAKVAVEPDAPDTGLEYPAGVSAVEAESDALTRRVLDAALRGDL